MREKIVYLTICRMYGCMTCVIVINIDKLYLLTVWMKNFSFKKVLKFYESTLLQDCDNSIKWDHYIYIVLLYYT